MAGSDREASKTALGVAALRAAHRLVDREPWLLDDPIAIRLLEPSAASRLEDSERIQHPLARGLRSHVLLRSRYTEDRLEEAVAAGVRQCVLLGAGFDTFAYRQPSWASILRIFEVDHPASQAAKQDRVRAAGLETPPNLVHAPIDFESVSLEDGLRKVGFDADAPAFFSWLGVTMYLTRPAIETVLRFVGGLPAGSRMALTFAQPETEEDRGAATLADLAASAGEPWLTRFAPEELEDELRRAGFPSIHILSPEEAFARYYQGRADALPPPRRASMAHAEV
jgi:methyltransferase (TIGR00027 family)